MNKNDITFGVTAFIDILGFSEKVLAAEDTADVVEIHEKIEFIQSAFEFESNEEWIQESKKLLGSTVLAFSDCVISHTPLVSNATKYEGSFDPIMSELTSMAYAQGQCCQNSLFIRGGVDLDWWYQSGSKLISKSMINAYNFESKASVPVIALTPKTYEYFETHKHREFYADYVDPVKGVFRKYSEDGLEFMYIDYIGLCCDSVGWDRTPEEVDKVNSASGEERENLRNEGYKGNVEE